MLSLLTLNARRFANGLISLCNKFVDTKVFSFISGLLILLAFMVGLFALWQGLHDLVKLIITIQYEGGF